MVSGFLKRWLNMRRNDDLRERVSELILEKVKIDEAVLAEEFGVCIKSIKRARKEVNAGLPRELREVVLASDAQVAALLKLSSQLGGVDDVEGLKAHLRALTTRQAAGRMKLLYKTLGTKLAWDSTFGQSVEKTTMRFIKIKII
jgi:hypothetical protein